VAKGGYILEDSNGTPELILIGTGTELELATKAAAVLRAEGANVRVVSMPCVELFEEQDAAYRESVLPAAVRKRLVVEASSSFGWHKYTGFDGDTVSIDRFGASAPGPRVPGEVRLYRRKRGGRKKRRLAPPGGSYCGTHQSAPAIVAPVSSPTSLVLHPGDPGYQRNDWIPPLWEMGVPG
jgi:hypothetical protein